MGGRERLHTDGFRSNDELELATPKDSVYERTVDGIQPGFSLFQVTQHSSAVVLFLLPSFFFLSPPIPFYFTNFFFFQLPPTTV